jgi:hypothetical protein
MDTVTPQERLERAKEELARVIVELRHQVDRESPQRVVDAFFGSREQRGLTTYDFLECAAFLERLTLGVRKRAIERQIDPPRPSRS